MKKAILAVSFGTSHMEQLGRCVFSVVSALQLAFPDYEVFSAFSSGMIIKKLKTDYDLTVFSPEEVLDVLVRKGYKEVIVQPLHLLAGKEYDKVVTSCKAYGTSFDVLRIGKPLLTGDRDYQALVAMMKAYYTKGDKFLLLIGHGTTHEADCAYRQLERVLKQQTIYGTISTLQHLDDAEAVAQAVYASGRTRVELVPLMLVAGMHVAKDIKGDHAACWQGALRLKGLEVDVIIKGLGGYEEVHKLFIAHVKEAEPLRITSSGMS